MSTIRKDKDGLFFFDGSVRGHRRRKYLGTRNRREAERRKRDLDRLVWEDRVGLIEASIDLSVFIERYLEYSRINKAYGTFREDKRILGEFSRFVGGVRLDEVRVEVIERWKMARSKGVSPRTVNKELRHLQAAFSIAVDWDLGQSNPFKRVKRLPVDEKVPVFLSPEEIVSVFDHLRGDVRPMVSIALYSGLRLGEVANLQWGDVDLERRLIRVVNRGTFHTKSRRERDIPMHDALYDVLVQLPRTGIALWPYKADWLTRLFKRAVRRGGLSESITFHSLRHTFASYLVSSGEPIRQVQQLLGHSDVRVTEIYAHLELGSLRKSVSALDFGLGRKGQEMGSV